MLKEILFYFLRLGCLGFGGPMAVIATMQRELILERRWMEPPQFLNTLSLIKAMPGPVAFQTAVYLGRHRGGFFGACLAALGLVLPSFLMMVALAWVFPHLYDLEGARGWMIGFQIAALVVIGLSLRSFTEAYANQKMFWVFVTAGAVSTTYAPAWEPLVILGAGAAHALVKNKVRTPFVWAGVLLPPVSIASVSPLFLSMFKAGALVFGTGLAIVPMLEYDVVQNFRWMSHGQFMEALALGQLTPGPVVITATYIGFHVAGLVGAVVATVGIFLPSFFHMTTWFPRVVNRLQGKSWIGDFTLGAIGAVVGSLVISVLRMGVQISWNWVTALSLISIVVLSLRRTPTWILIPAGGFICAVLNALRAWT